jgi:hypothetical protein
MIQRRYGTKMVKAGLLALGVALGGCSTLDTRTPEEIVADRAQQHLDALMARDYEKAFGYTTPGYRAANTARMYSSAYAGAGFWLGAKVDQVVCTPAEAPVKCEVRAKVTYKAPRQKLDLERILNHRWLNVDGVWYRYEG